MSELKYKITRKTVLLILSQRFVEQKSQKRVKRLFGFGPTVGRICRAATGHKTDRDKVEHLYWYPWVMTWVKNHPTLMEKIKNRRLTKEKLYSILDLSSSLSRAAVAQKLNVSPSVVSNVLYIPQGVYGENYRRVYWYPWREAWLKENGTTEAKDKADRAEKNRLHKETMKQLEINRLLIGLGPNPWGRDIPDADGNKPQVN